MERYDTHCSHGAISKLNFTRINQMNICILVISHLLAGTPDSLQRLGMIATG